MSEKVTVATSYSAATATTLAGLTLNEWVAITGIMLGLATFITNLYFKREHLKLARQKKAAQDE